MREKPCMPSCLLEIIPLVSISSKTNISSVQTKPVNSQMNFLIFDDEGSSLNLINKLLDEFYYVKLITANESSFTIPSSSSFLSIKQGDISNAAQVLENFSTHENDPFDVVLIFNLSLYTSLNNVIRTIERLKRQPPRLFLIFIAQQHETNKNINKLLNESSQFLQWTIIICNEINASTSITKYRIETKSEPTNPHSTNATDLLNLLRDELKMKKYFNQIIYLYQS